LVICKISIIFVLIITKNLFLKTLLTIFFIIVMLFLLGCKDDNIDAGAKGTIKIGEGSCAPPIDYSARYYFDYDGIAYFVDKTSLDSLGGSSYDQLLKNSDSTNVENGNYIASLSAGTFYVILKDRTYTNADNYNRVINVYFEKVTEQDFEFWKCTSY